MASKIFIDANILLDFTLQRSNYEEAKKLIELVIKGELQGYVTPAIIHITGYWLTKSYGAKKAKEILLMLLSDIRVIDASHSVTINALHSKINDIEDALQYYSALHHKLDYFITKDGQLKKEGIPILPIYGLNEFLKMIST
jgi:predicted nucleic acid-binding protein